jgi:hypothetical protein
MGRQGGLVSGVRRSVRERFREDAETHYETLFASLIEAVEASTTRWGDCPGCGHRVPVVFPDIRARTHAVEVLIDQGYRKAAANDRLHITTSHPTTMEKLRQLSDEELEALIAACPPGELLPGEEV